MKVGVGVGPSCSEEVAENVLALTVKPPIINRPTATNAANAKTFKRERPGRSFVFPFVSGARELFIILVLLQQRANSGNYSVQ